MADYIFKRRPMKVGNLIGYTLGKTVSVAGHTITSPTASAKALGKFVGNIKRGFVEGWNDHVNDLERRAEQIKEPDLQEQPV